MFLCNVVPPEAAINALILLQSSLSLVELYQDGGVGDIDQDVHEDSEDDEGQDEIDWRGVAKNALNVTSEPSDLSKRSTDNNTCDTLLVEYDVSHRDAGRKEPAAQEGDDDPDIGHDGAVLEGRGDVEEPVQGQHPDAGDGDPDNPQPDPNLGVALTVRVAGLIPHLVAEGDHDHHHHSEREVGHREVEDEYEDGLGVDPGVEDGGEGGEDDQQVEQGLGDELEDGHDAETVPHCLSSCHQPRGLARLKV